MLSFLCVVVWPLPPLQAVLAQTQHLAQQLTTEFARVDASVAAVASSRAVVDAVLGIKGSVAETTSSALREVKVGPSLAGRSPCAVWLLGRLWLAFACAPPACLFKCAC